MLKPTCRWLVQETHFHSQIHAPRFSSFCRAMGSSPRLCPTQTAHQHIETMPLLPPQGFTITDSTSTTAPSSQSLPPHLSPLHTNSKTLCNLILQGPTIFQAPIIQVMGPDFDAAYVYWIWTYSDMKKSLHHLLPITKGGEAFSDIIKVCCVLFAPTWS